MEPVEFKLNIPDLWFDFYARFLPGAAFAGVVYLSFWDSTTSPSSGTELVIFLILGFLVALMVQPFGSSIASWIEGLVEKKRKRELAELYPEKDMERLFIMRVQQEIGPDSRRAMILDKMHGEVTFFAQLITLCVLCVLVKIFVYEYSHYHELCGEELCSLIYPTLLFIALIIYFGGCGCEVANRRISRAIQYKKIKNWEKEKDSFPSRYPCL